MSRDDLFVKRTTVLSNSFTDTMISIIYENIRIQDLNMAIMKMAASGMLRREEW
jgi:hypothetical protein